MAVYTKLSLEEIKKFLENYDIGNLISYKEIIDGIDNSNFIILTSKGKFILTIFEKRINKDDLPFFINIKKHLSKKGILCPEPIKNKQNLFIGNLKNKHSLIVSFLQGETLKPEQNGIYNSVSNKHCLNIGKNLALMHLGVQDFQEIRENDLGANKFRSFFNKMSNEVENYQTGLKEEIEKYLEFLDINWQNNLPKGACHLDLFPDNVFFDTKQEVSGIIDFYFCATDLFIYDLAIIINAWSFYKDNIFDENKYTQIIEGYKNYRKIEDKEQNFLKVALLAASLRFLLTRLYDKFNTPEGSFVKIKDPDEYLEKTRYFFNKIID